MANLPGRSELARRIETMLIDWRVAGESGSAGLSAEANPAAASPVGASHLPEPKPPAAYAIGIVDYRRLVELDEEGMDKAIDEITWRLDKLVRSGDVLGMIAPDTFLLGTASMAPSSAGVVMERISGAVAMPLEINGDAVSLRVAIGLAFAFDGASPEAMLSAAERDLQRSLGD